MRKLFALIAALSLLVTGYPADAANDLLLSQRKPDNSGNIQRNVPAQNAITSGSLPSFQSGIGLGVEDTPNFTGVSYGVTTPGSITGLLGAINVTASGSSQSITASPSGTGNVEVLLNTSIVDAFPTGQGLRITGPDAVGPTMILDGFGASPTLLGRRAGGTRAAQTALTNGNALVTIAGRGYNGAAYSSASRGGLLLVARNTWNSSPGYEGTVLSFNFVPRLGDPASVGSTSTVTALQFGAATGWATFNPNGATLSFSAAWGVSGPGLAFAASTFNDEASSGTVATSAIHAIARPTISAAAVTTFTNSATLYVANAPANGTNVTQTNPYALWVDDGNVRFDANTWTAGEVQTGTTQALAARINYNLAAYGTGTVYTLTNTAAAVAFGTTSPSVTLDKAGTYLIQGRIQMAYTGATVVAETATVKLRRTNNTAADLTSGSTVVDLPVATTLTYTYGTVQIPPVIYTTTNTNDIVTIFANVSATLGAGTITAEVGGTNITAIRMY